MGSLFSFMTSLQEASAVLFLALGGWESITNGIFAFYIAGSANEAAALGVILIVVASRQRDPDQPHRGDADGRRVRYEVVRDRPAHDVEIHHEISDTAAVLSLRSRCDSVPIHMTDGR